MNGCDERCVVCGEPSAALICFECEALLRADGAMSRKPPMLASTPAGGRGGD